MNDPELPEFKPRDISEQITVTLPSWMACMYMAEVRAFGGPSGAVEYINNAIKKELFTQRTVNEQEAMLQAHHDLQQFGLRAFQQMLGDNDDDPRGE